MSLAGPDPTRAHISSLDGLGRSIRTGSHPCTHNNDRQQLVRRFHRALLRKLSKLSSLIVSGAPFKPTFSPWSERVGLGDIP